MPIVGYHGEWTPSALARIVLHGAEHCQYFVLVVAKGRSSEAVELLHDLMPYLVARRIVKAWPGTMKLAGEASEMLKFEVNRNTVEVLVGAVLPVLFMPDPPVEDLSLLRLNGRPWFIMITHERDAFLKLEAQEIERVRAAIGADNLVVEGDDEFPEEKY